ISVWNYTNTAVTLDELKRATSLAVEILQEVGSHQEEATELSQRYLKRPRDILRFSGLEKTLSRSISDEAIREKALYVESNRANYDPKVALGVKLDELWLMVVDEQRWKDSGSLKTAKNAAFVLREIEGYREQLREVKTESEFLQLSEQIRTLLKGGLGVKGEGTWRSLKDFT